MTAGRWFALIGCVVLAMPMGLGLLNLWLSALSTDPSSDPHGYGLMFGFLFCVVFGSPFFVLLPFVGLPERRQAWTLASLAGFVVVVGGAFVLLVVRS